MRRPLPSTCLAKRHLEASIGRTYPSRGFFAGEHEVPVGRRKGRKGGNTRGEDGLFVGNASSYGLIVKGGTLDEEEKREDRGPGLKKVDRTGKKERRQRREGLGKEAGTIERGGQILGEQVQVNQGKCRS